jgi:hypothetical protein
MRRGHVDPVIKQAAGLLIVFGLLALNQAGAQGLPDRIVVDTRAECRKGPSASSASLGRVQIGDYFGVKGTADEGGAAWYLAGGPLIGLVTTQPCWIYGSYTADVLDGSLDARDTEARWLAVLDHVLARNDATFEEDVEVDALLSWWSWFPGTNTPLIQLRRLQLIAKAGSLVEDSIRDILASSPLKLAWLESHLKFFEPGRVWYVPAERYWELFDANPTAPWAEQAAWAAQHPQLPECEYNACALDTVIEGSLQYWKRLPAGAHIHEVLTDALEEAKYAAHVAPFGCDRSKPRQQWDSPVPPTIVAEIRASLAPVTAPEKDDILKFLDEAERICGQ